MGCCDTGPALQGWDGFKYVRVATPLNLPHEATTLLCPFDVVLQPRRLERIKVKISIKAPAYYVTDATTYPNITIASTPGILRDAKAIEIPVLWQPLDPAARTLVLRAGSPLIKIQPIYG